MTDVLHVEAVSPSLSPKTAPGLIQRRPLLVSFSAGLHLYLCRTAGQLTLQRDAPGLPARPNAVICTLLGWVGITVYYRPGLAVRSYVLIVPSISGRIPESPAPSFLLS
jgi:hypothetical protein